MLISKIFDSFICVYLFYIYSVLKFFFRELLNQLAIAKSQHDLHLDEKKAFLEYSKNLDSKINNLKNLLQEALDEKSKMQSENDNSKIKIIDFNESLNKLAIDFEESLNKNKVLNLELENLKKKQNHDDNKLVERNTVLENENEDKDTKINTLNIRIGELEENIRRINNENSTQNLLQNNHLTERNNENCQLKRDVLFLKSNNEKLISDVLMLQADNTNLNSHLQDAK